MKFVSTASGDAGHCEMGGGALAKRRRAEVQDAAFMVQIPRVMTDVPAPRRNAVFPYYEDNFQKPQSYEAQPKC